MSHDRGCYLCGVDPRDYGMCRRRDCPKIEVTNKPKKLEQMKHEECTEREEHTARNEKHAKLLFDAYWSRAPASLVQFGFPEWEETDKDEKFRWNMIVLAVDDVFGNPEIKARK